MKLDKRKVDLIRARKCMTLEQMRVRAKCSPNSIQKGFKEDIDPITINKIAKALEVDVTEIVE